MIIYHGSNVAVENPKILQSGRMLDFGDGFYTTSNKAQAIRWASRVAARRENSIEVVTEYEYDKEAAEKNLKILHFDKPDEEWLDFVCLNRSGDTLLQPYDIVCGPVADDDVYGTVVLYEQGFLDKDEAIKRFKVRELYDQILFHTEESLKYLRYITHNKTGGTHDGSK